MPHPTLAIVGTGIAGLGCAHFLHARFDLTLFESNEYIGGHTNTVTVSESGRQVPIDTGFMVFNQVTYPNLVRLFRELKVPTKPTDMSFSVQHTPTQLEFCGTSLNHLFAQRRNLLKPRFWNLLSQINRFNAEAVPALSDPQWAEMTVKTYVERRGYGNQFLELYLIPMSSAVWSTPPDQMLEFPALTLLRFFHNHGFLGLHTQHPWWTVVGGAHSYVQRLTPPFANRIRLGCGVREVHRRSNGVEVWTRSGGTHHYDHVILACHADEALRLLVDADDLERRLLGEFRYQPNIAQLHTDESVMPKTRLAWSSWNYRTDRDSQNQLQHQTIYWMNRLQQVSEKQNYFVSINGEHSIDPSRVLRRIEYTHPLFSLGAIRAQRELPGLNSRTARPPVTFCGSYFRYGFHEDAFTSALELCRQLTGEALWTSSEPIHSELS